MRLNSSFFVLAIVLAIFFNGCGGGSDSSNVSDDIHTTDASNDVNDSLVGESKPLPKALTNTINVGFGGRNAYSFASENSDSPIWVNSVSLLLNESMAENSSMQQIKNFDAEQFTTLQKYLVKSKYLAYWITKGWEENWFTLSRIQEAMDAGYVPVFIYYYFGDELSAVPSGDVLTNYYEDTKRVANLLKALNGTKLVIMEPEFNKEAILESNASMRAFAEIMAQGIDNLEENVSDVYFSLCMTDTGRRGVNVVADSCGYDNCALGDQNAWSEADEIYDFLKDKISFLSFQEMVAQFSRDPLNPGAWESPNPINYTDEEIGIEYLDERILNFSAYLHKKYNKPVFVPYITIPTATWDDLDNSETISSDEVNKEGWRLVPQEVYGGLKGRQEALKESGLFGYLPMALFDNPRQDYGGYQYFIDDEYHFGLIETSAEDAVDKYIYGDLSFKGNVLEKVFGEL